MWLTTTLCYQSVATTAKAAKYTDDLTQGLHESYSLYYVGMKGFFYSAHYAVNYNSLWVIYIYEMFFIFGKLTR